MRALVTGADGFVGQWLVRRLLRDDVAVTGVIRGSAPSLTTLDEALAARVTWMQCNVADESALKSAVGASKPVAVFHLAAQSSVPESNKDPLITFDINVMGTARLLEAVRELAPEAAVLVVGSADAYGAVTSDQLPLSESAPLAPRNPYAASKAAAERIAVQYAKAGWCRAVVTRSFNHTGPGQSTAFAVASFAKQIADMQSGRANQVLEVGDLHPRRDISDVRDVVDAYVLLARVGQPGAIYNVCSGTDRSMQELAEELMRIAKVKADTRIDPKRVRPVETPVLRGDPSLIERQTGWKVKIPTERTLTDMLAFFSRAAT